MLTDTDRITELRKQVEEQSHPAAALFPFLNTKELLALADDIKLNGQRDPVVTDSDGRIIDGRNRTLACRLLGKEPITKVSDKPPAEIPAYVASANVFRRHLAIAPRAAIFTKLCAMRDAATTAPTANLQDTASDSDLAAELKISERTAYTAKKIARVAPALVEAMANDSIKVHAAEQIADLGQDDLGIATALVQAGKIKEAKTLAKSRRTPRTTSYVYSDLLAALEDLPRLLYEHPPGPVVLEQIAEAITAAVSALRDFEENQRADTADTEGS